MATEANYDYRGLAKQRLLWALKPIMAVCIIVWILHPATATDPDVNKMQLKGFLIGAIFGLVVYRETLKHFMSKTMSIKETKNRIPEEYYMGHIEKVLRGKDEREV